MAQFHLLFFSVVINILIVMYYMIVETGIQNEGKIKTNYTKAD